MSTAISDAQAERLLTAARRGDEGAYRDLVESHRRELHAHCYRMLGSVHDAEDALQDAMLRAWKGLQRFEGRSSARSWLYKIATNTCLDEIAKRPKRVLPMDYGPATEAHIGAGQPLVETVWIEPYPDAQLGVAAGASAPAARYEQRESLELAFVAALQHLPATQRAVLIMREVLGFSAKETAEALETTVASVNSALQRARATIDAKLPDQSQQQTLRALGDDELRAAVERYMDAMQAGDVERVVAMLTEEATWSMPPLASWFGPGLAQLRVFLEGGPMSGAWQWRHVPTFANGQAAVGCYTWDEQQGVFLPFCIDVLTLARRPDGEAAVAGVTAFITRSLDVPDEESFLRFPDHTEQHPPSLALFERFGLPLTLARD
ncbi:sigma-70 family RNA polymerase sigma factor [Patulibacter defluvii]|uniref:sigma-70 family RNA polymerase sigma factor n=1 Tax=Patulibacter defluvii TaxID=3095358 RepID=UPI002A7562C9|nr:sigma-70 family RNA polymerase sigma factor [Patulibacter sp. DM4]